ncbi:Glutathione S-transferase U28 [Linum perenne]
MAGANNKEELILLNWGVSPFSARVKIALAEKGVTNYESRHEDVHNKSSLLMEMNPATNQIPVLIHNNKPISDSLVIIHYIDEFWNHDSHLSLLPSHPYHRARARFWADYTSKVPTFHLGFGLWKSNEEKVKEASRKEMCEMLENLQEELGEKSYFGGDKFGFVDIALIPFHSFFYTFEKVGGMDIVNGFPKLMEWAERCIRERESVSKTLWDSHNTYQVIFNYRKRMGLE